MQPVCVRENGGSPHYRVDAVYIPDKDGVKNPEANLKSTDLLKQCSSSALNLALAWRLSGEPRYAECALEWIHTWCINQNTRMFPTGGVEDAMMPGAQYGGDISLFSVLPGLFLAGHILDAYEGWDLRAHAATRDWVRNMVEPQRHVMFFAGSEMYNNWEDARLEYLATAGLMLNDLDLLNEVFDRWTMIVPLKMTEEGELTRETMRSRSMNYTMKSLQHALKVAEIARRCGRDLFELNVNGRSMRKAVDYAAKYLLNIEKWPFEQITPLEKSIASRGCFEIAYSQWKEPRFLEVIEQWGGRPVIEECATLLYADPR